MSDGGGKFADGIAGFRRMLTAVDIGARLAIFTNAAHEIAGYVAKGLPRADAADELADMAVLSGFEDPDEVQAIIAEAFARIEKPAGPPKGNGHDQRGLRIYSKSEFIRGFIPPDYLIDGIIQRRFVYSLTGQTSHAKTAIALLFAELIASPDPNSILGSHRVEKGQVAYFVGENPDDVRMRVIGADSTRDDAGDDRIFFIPGVFNIAQMQVPLRAALNDRGGFDLVIIDTSAAYFLGQDENANQQIGTHARMLRGLTEMPGGPCVLVLCHPIKHATDPSQLLPRGGGAFLAEMDGNLTCWKHDDLLVELHHGKMRGPGFEAISFKLEQIRTPNLVDAKGRQLPTIRAIPISQSDEDQQTSKTRSDEDRVLAARLKAGETEVPSVAEIAMRLTWTFTDGSPAKSRVQRVLERLEKARPPLVYRDRGQWKLTEKGKEAARTAALRIAAEDEAKHANQFSMELH